MTVFGYARVITADQHLTGQIEALKAAAGATTIYREKISGVRADRPQLAQLMAALKPSDVVLVTKPDRLGRSTRELLDLIDRIGKAGAVFGSLGEPPWDTLQARRVGCSPRAIRSAAWVGVVTQREWLASGFSRGFIRGHYLPILR
jgi:resolvase-like protein